MYHTVVMTCGVSVLSGANTFQDKFINGNLNAPIETMSKEMNNKIEQYVASVRHNLNKIEDDQRVSAEYSMITSLIKQQKLHKKARVILVVTNTVGGTAAEQALSYIFSKHLNLEVNTLYVDISVSDEQKFRQQLAEYMRNIANALSEGEPMTTCFAPLGGYKVMTSLGYIVGSFLQYPTAYLHEEQQLLITIPPMPLDISEDFIQQHMSLVKKCAKEVNEITEFSVEEIQVIHDNPAIFTVEDGCVIISAFGEFLFERAKYQQLFDMKYMISNQVRNKIEKNKQQRLFIESEIQKLGKEMRDLCENKENMREEYVHERTFSTLKPPYPYHLYKGTSNGSTHVFRLAYKYDPKNDVLYANYLWLNHDDYDREVKKEVGLKEVEKGLTEYSMEG